MNMSVHWFQPLSVDPDTDPASPLGRLDNDGYGLAAAPFKLVGFPGGLSDKSFPGYVGFDLRVAGAVPDPADHGVRIKGNGIAGHNVAENDRITVGQYGDAGIVSLGRQGRGGKTLLGKNAAADKTYAVVAVLCKGKDIFGFNGNGFSHFQFINDHMLPIAGIIGSGTAV